MYNPIYATQHLDLDLMNCWSFSYWFIKFFYTWRKFSQNLWWVLNVSQLVFEFACVSFWYAETFTLSLIYKYFSFFFFASQFYVKVRKTFFIRNYKTFLPYLVLLWLCFLKLKWDPHTIQSCGSINYRFNFSFQMAPRLSQHHLLNKFHHWFEMPILSRPVCFGGPFPGFIFYFIDL